MAALTTDRNTKRRYIERAVAENAQLAATTTIFNGAIVASNATGALVPGSDTAALTVIGVAPQKMVNTGGAAATVSPPARAYAGCFKFDTTGGNAITAADIGKTCCALDDHTVVRAAGTVNSIVVGVVDSIDSDGGVWVKVNC
jgi:hypothetical protein